MALKRLLAVVATVVMVVGALVTRRFLDDGGELSISGAQSTIYCDIALAEACRSVFPDAIIEAPGTTLDRFLDPTDDVAVWIAADLWFDILDGEQARLRRGDAITDTSAPIAHSPLVLLGTACDPVAWTCFADLSPNVDVGIDSLDSSAGVAGWVQIVAVELDNPNFAANDFDLAFNEWRRKLDAHTTFSPARQPVLDVYLTRPGTYDLIVTTQAQVLELGRDDLALVPSDSGPEVQVGAVAVGGARLPGDLDKLGDELDQQGWLTGSMTESERPSGGAMQALRS